LKNPKGDDPDALAILEIDFRLQTLPDKKTVIPKDSHVFMYASLQSIAGATI
jgi:hypothetical protein